MIGRKFSVLFFGSIFAFLCSAESQAETALRLSHVRPVGSVADFDLQALGIELQKTSGIRIKIYPNSELGDYTAVQDKISTGVIDMALQPLSPVRDERLRLASLPYLVYDWDDAKLKFGKDGGIRKSISAFLDSHDIKMLAVYPQYFGGISVSDDITLVPRSKIYIRTPLSQGYLATMHGFGAVEVPYLNIKSAINNGSIGGISGSGAEGYYSNFLAATKHYIVANTHFEVWFLLIGRKVYDALSPKDKESLRQAVIYFEAKRWSRAENLQAFNEKRLRDSGVKIHRLSDEEMRNIGAQVRKSVWPSVFLKIDSELND